MEDAAGGPDRRADAHPRSVHPIGRMEERQHLRLITTLIGEFAGSFTNIALATQPVSEVQVVEGEG
jgi:hypothetical protein